MGRLKVVVVFLVLLVGGVLLGSLGEINLCASGATAALDNVAQVNLLHAVFVVASGVLSQGSCQSRHLLQLKATRYTYITLVAVFLLIVILVILIVLVVLIHGGIAHLLRRSLALALDLREASLGRGRVLGESSAVLRHVGKL